MSLDFSKAKYVGEYKEDNDTAEVPAFDFSQAKYVGEYKEERTWAEAAADTGLDLAKGVVGIGESAIGLADLVTGNKAGEALASVGYDPEETKRILGSGYSEARQAANKNVSDAKGFWNTAEALIDNPSAAVGAMVESAPMMIGSAAAVRAAATKMLAARGIAAGSPAAAAFLNNPATVAKLTAIGSGAEGAMTAGNIQEQGRQAGRDYLDTAPAAVAGGAVTGLIGFGTSKIPGFKDVEVGAAVAGMGGSAQRQTLIAAGKEIAKGTFKEGVLEELPQSAQEQVFTNLATGKPWDEGVAEAAAQGMVAGAGMGGGMSTYAASRNALAGAASEAGRAYDPNGAALQDFADAVEGANYAQIPPEMGQDTAETSAARESALAAWNDGIGARRAPAAKTPEQVLADIINDAPAESAGAAHPTPAEADTPAAPVGETEAGQLDQQTLLDQIERQVFGENEGRDGRQDQVSGDSRGDDATGGGAAVDGLPAVPLAGEGTAGADTAIDVAGAAMGVPGKPGAALTQPAITVTPRKDGTAVVTGEGAQEAVANIVPKASMIQRADGSVLVGATYAPAVQQALQSMQTAGQPTEKAVLQQAPTALSIPQEISARIAKRTDAELAVMEKSNEDPAIRLAAQQEQKRRAAPIMQRDDLVGAIMRITGGRGINPDMALTLTGDTANRQPRLRGLFKKGGTSDMSDLAELLRVEQGYDVRDGTRLEELIREQAAGNPVYSMERNERDAAESAERQYRDEINKRAVELGLKQARGKRTLEMVEADIARVEQEQNDMEAQEERAAIQAESVFTEMYDKEMELAPPPANAQPSTKEPTLTESDLLPLMAKAMGSETLARVLLDSGLVTGVRRGADFQGATFEDGRIILNLDALTADNFAGVFKHEGFHSTIHELLGEAKYNQLMKRLDGQMKLAKGNAWVDQARAAVPADTKPEHVAEEIGAYAIEQVENGAKAPGFIKRWVREFLSAIRAAVIRYAKTDSKLQAWAMNNMKPEDLARLAVAGLRAKALGAMQGQTQMREAVAYSKLFAKVDQIAKAFEQRITQAFIQGRADKPILVAENTPSSMQMLGWKDRNIVVNFKELEKIGNKAGFETNEKIASIVHDLRRPALMFWNTKTKSLNFMRKGSPNMVIGVAPEVSQGRGENAHLVLTAHFLSGDDVKSLQNKISRGELVLIYKGDEVQGISGLAEMKQPQFRRGLAEGLLPTRDAEAEAVPRILREADMIKWENEKWRDSPKFSRAQTPLPGATQQQPGRKPDLPADTLARKQQRMWQDKLNRFTVIKEWLADNNVTLSEQGDVYKAEERMHSRFANKAQDFREKRVMPLVQKVQKAGFKMEDVAQFLHANHAQARNAQIAKINKSLPDGGSGMTNADAQAILAAAPAELKALALEFRSITDDTTQILLSSGVIDQDAVNAWKNAYGDTYVPLKGGPDENAAKTGTGKGLSLKHKQKRALGHDTRAEGEWIIENILADHERALMAAEKNRVFHSLVKMALETAHLDLVTINKPEKRQVLMNQAHYVVRKKGAAAASFRSDAEARAFIQYDAAVTKASRGDYVIEKSNDPSVALMASPMPAPDEATGYINGQLVRLQFNDPLMAEAYNNMGTEAMNVAFRVGRVLNTFFSKVYTVYSPEFLLTNVIRDFTTGLANVTGEEGVAMAGKAAKNYAARFFELAKYAATGNETKWVKMYREDGGNTGAAYLSDLERLGTDVQTEYAVYQGVMKNVADGNYLTAARAAGRKTLGKLLYVLEVANMAGENAMRLAVYQSMIESGKSRAEAASMAKNVTVNFNRKGTLGQHANAAYLFFNAGVQGTAALAHAHFKGKHKFQAWGVSGTLVGLGYMLSLLAAGDDENEYEKLNEFERERNVLVKTKERFAKIPVPYGYGFFWNLGRAMADAQRTGEVGKMPWRLAASFVSEFTPFGAVVAGKEADGKQAFLYAMPTAAQIVGAPLMNKTSFGSPMMPESGFDRNQPDRDKINRGTRGTLADDLAGALEAAGLDVSPETLKFLWRTGTGGAGTIVTSAIDAAKLKAQGADLDIKEIPFVRKLYTETDVRGARARYYEAKDEVDKVLSAFKRAQKKGDDSLADKIEKENQDLIDMAYMARAMTAEIKAARDRIDSVRLSGEYTKAEERMIIKQMEKEEAEIYDDFIALFKEAKHRSRK